MQGTRKLGLIVVAALVSSIGRDDAFGQSPSKAHWSSLVPKVEGSRHHHVAPGGKASNPGTRDDPWDLASALGGQHKVAPGDVIWVHGGTYRGTFEVNLAGKDDAPIHVRAYPGERATILDSKVSVVPSSSEVWLWDLEIAGSVPTENRETKQAGSHPSNLPGGDGINLYGGRHHKLISLVVHDNVGTGIGWWKESNGGEIHGCSIYRNGWKAPDRTHGHCIYTQNQDDLKTISNNIMSVAPDVGSYSVHAYGSAKAYVDNYLIEDNIVYGNGPFLVGGGRPSHNIKVLRNYLYGVPMRIGYGPVNEDCEIRDNVLAKGTLQIDKYKVATEEGNIKDLPDRKVALIPNKYDPDRAHLAIYNGARDSEVPVDLASFLRSGEVFRLMDPQDVFGKPILEGTYGGETLAVPMKGEFAAFVILKDTSPK